MTTVIRRIPGATDIPVGPRAEPPPLELLEFCARALREWVAAETPRARPIEPSRPVALEATEGGH